jgi:hypothetical protein
MLRRLFGGSKPDPVLLPHPLQESAIALEAPEAPAPALQPQHPLENAADRIVHEVREFRERMSEAIAQARLAACRT